MAIMVLISLEKLCNGYWNCLLWFTMNEIITINIFSMVIFGVLLHVMLFILIKIALRNIILIHNDCDCMFLFMLYQYVINIIIKWFSDVFNDINNDVNNDKMVLE